MRRLSGDAASGSTVSGAGPDPSPDDLERKRSLRYRSVVSVCYNLAYIIVGVVVGMLGPSVDVRLSAAPS